MRTKREWNENICFLIICLCYIVYFWCVLYWHFYNFATQKNKRTRPKFHFKQTFMIDPRTNLPENARTQVVIQCTIDDLRDILRDVVLLNASDKKEQPEQKQKYLTIEQAAELLHVNRSTLWRWNKDKYLCPIKVGHKTLYRHNDVESILQIES